MNKQQEQPKPRWFVVMTEGWRDGWICAEFVQTPERMDVAEMEAFEAVVEGEFPEDDRTMTLYRYTEEDYHRRVHVNVYMPWRELGLTYHRLEFMNEHTPDDNTPVWKRMEVEFEETWRWEACHIYIANDEEDAYWSWACGHNQVCLEAL